MGAPQNDNRYWILDTLRGWYILTMIVAHTIFFFHTDTHPVLQGVQWIFDFISFSGLLFVSGATGYIAYIHFSHPTLGVMWRVFRRLIAYVIGYWILAVWISWVTVGFDNSLVLSILTMRHFVPFTEFLIPFIVFGALKVPLRSVYHALSSSIFFTIPTAVVLYSLGVYLYGMSVPEIWIPLKAIFAGHPGIYTFPLLQYAPIYLFGLFVGRRLWDARDTGSYTPHLGLYATIILSGVGFATMYSRNVGLSFTRWPPAPGFVLLGLGIALIMLSFFQATNALRRFWISRTILLAFGQNAFSVFITHTFLGYLWQAMGYARLPLLWHISLLSVASATIALYLARVLPLNVNFGLTWVGWCECRLGYCTHNVHPILSDSIRRFLGDLITLPQFVAIPLGRYRLPIFTYWVPAVSLSIIIFFGLPQIVSVPLGVHPDIDRRYIQVIQESQGKTPRKWYLVSKENTRIDYTISAPDLSLIPNNEMRVIVQIDGVLSGDMERTVDGWKTQLSAADYRPGPHAISTLFIINGRNVVSQPSMITISAPVYVTWTIDWEGYDVKPEYLKALFDIADEHKLPLTHLFNPRIYTPAVVTAQRADELTDLVKARRDTKGEEIGLHLHMFPDFVSASGLKPKLEPAWGGGFSPGYDILTSAYTTDEMKQILLHAKKLFAQKGLGDPKSYRAGGWFADEKTLQALAETGFTVDSSGRTAYKFGTKNVEGHWNLAPTSQPYYPSVSDQNSSEPGPKLTLMEIPDNGADDYAFSAREMIDRFVANYKGDFVTKPVQVTFLSHPHWLDPQRQQAMRQVFDYVDKWSYEKDQGPAVYTTLQGVYEAFKEPSSP